MPRFGSERKANTDLARESEAKPSVEKSSVENSEANVEKTAVATAREARSSGWVSQWGSKLSSLVSQKPKPTRSAIPRFNGRSVTDATGVPVQGELSLDNIRVMRNDLSDADLEVVTRKTAPAKEAEVGRASPRADGFVSNGIASAARGDARPTMSEMLSAVNP